MFVGGGGGGGGGWGCVIQEPFNRNKDDSNPFILNVLQQLYKPSNQGDTMLDLKTLTCLNLQNILDSPA